MLKSNLRAVELEMTRLLKMKNAAAGVAVSNEAKKLAPVDTGRLRSSLTWDSDETGAVIGTNVEYAPVQELGSVNQRPQPFLVPGLIGAKATLGSIYGS